MPDDRVTLVRWRDTKTQPPTSGDYMVLVYDDRDGAGEVGLVNAILVADAPEIYPQWAMFPTPPGEDALTLEDLSNVLRNALNMSNMPYLRTDLDSIDRLRRAIDALEGQDA